MNNFDASIELYNNRVHGTTKMTLFEDSNNKLIPSFINHDNNKLHKFQVGDFVRVPDKRYLYCKGHTTIRNRELFEIL